MYTISAINPINKSKLKITFEDDSELIISKSNYLRVGFLYPGKIIDEYTFAGLIKYEAEEPYREYLRKLLQKGYYSVYQCMVRLIRKKELDPKDARRLVGDLEREGIIDDKDFIEVKIDIMRYQGKAPDYIRNYLKYNAKVDEELIDEYEEMIDDVDLDLQEIILNSIFERHRKRPLVFRRRKAKNYLLKKGYSYDDCNRIIAEYSSEHEELTANDYDEVLADLLAQKLIKKYSGYYGPTKRRKVEEGLFNQGYYREDYKDILAPYSDEFLESDEDQVHEDFEMIYKKFIEGRGLNKTERRKKIMREMAKRGHGMADILSVIGEKENE